jgi:Fe2+ or Zn2+ uptake regulation protein
MSNERTAVPQLELNRRLATSGLRFTNQRRHVYDVLLHKRDHPTADEVFLRAKNTMPEISMATVYNCLDALVKCGLIRQVTVDRGASRFCPNMHDHCHFHCEQCGGVFDIELEPGAGPQPRLPRGYQATRFEVSIRGFCPGCGKKARRQNA